MGEGADAPLPPRVRVWDGLTAWRRWLPVLSVATYWAAVARLGGFRSDHVGVGILILALSYGGVLARRILQFLLPLILTGIVYDSQRYYPSFLRGAVHVAEPYAFEKRFFGIHTPGGVLTPSEWWQLHTHPLLDLLTGFCYLVFIVQFVLAAAYFVFWVGRKGTQRRSAEFVRSRSPRVMWSLLWLNVLGYLTHNLYPTAPPWYVERYGFGAVHLNVAPDPAGTVRFDQMLRTEYFAAFYGRSVDAFGAIPSLHIAFPMLALYYAVQFGAARAVSAAFLLAMCFSAVYLNHHYVIDLFWGVVYALVVGIGVDTLTRRAQRTSIAQ